MEGDLDVHLQRAESALRDARDAFFHRGDALLGILALTQAKQAADDAIQRAAEISQDALDTLLDNEKKRRRDAG